MSNGTSIAIVLNGSIVHQKVNSLEMFVRNVLKLNNVIKDGDVGGHGDDCITALWMGLLAGTLAADQITLVIVSEHQVHPKTSAADCCGATDTGTGTSDDCRVVGGEDSPGVNRQPRGAFASWRAGISPGT